MSYSSSSRVLTSNCGRTIGEIYNIFRRHLDSLFEEQSKANQAINDWSSSLMNQIGDHARKQKGLVEEAYKIHEKHFEDIQNQCVEIYMICERNNDTEEIKRLLETCKTLKVNLVDLKFPLINKEFIEVTIIEPSKQMQQEEYHSITTEDDKLKNRSIGDKGTASSYDPGSNFGSHSKSTATPLNRANQTSITQPTYNYNPSTNTTENKNPKVDVDDAGNTVDKCPVCFMIFPTYMSTAYRSMHMEEHYKDE